VSDVFTNIPHCPEPIEIMRERLPLALVKVNRAGPDRLAIDLDKPGDLPSHIFDFEDGMRIVVSRDEIKGVIFIHVSFSWFLPKPSGKTDADVRSGMQKGLSDLGLMLPLREHADLLTAHIPHWFWDEVTHVGIHEVFARMEKEERGVRQ